MIWEINSNRYIEFTQEKYNQALAAGNIYFCCHECFWKDVREPDTTFFILTVFNSRKKAQEEYNSAESKNSFIGHLIEDNAIELTENHDTAKFLVELV